MPGDRAQGLVVKDHKRGNAFFLSQFCPQLTQAFKELRIDGEVSDGAIELF